MHKSLTLAKLITNDLLEQKVLEKSNCPLSKSTCEQLQINQ